MPNRKKSKKTEISAEDKLYRKRSRASKKGWVTRRANIAAAEKARKKKTSKPAKVTRPKAVKPRLKPAKVARPKAVKVQPKAVKSRVKSATAKVRPKAVKPRPKAVKSRVKSATAKARPKAVKKPRKKRISLKQIVAGLSKTEKTRLTIELGGTPNDFVSGYENTRRDGTKAHSPSSLRHYKDFDRIYRSLTLAEKRGRLEAKAYQLADDFGVDVREIYTLFMSP